MFKKLDEKFGKLVVASGDREDDYPVESGNVVEMAFKTDLSQMLSGASTHKISSL
jgi:hypothetical protein